LHDELNSLKNRLAPAENTVRGLRLALGNTAALEQFHNDGNIVCNELKDVMQLFQLCT